MDGIRLAKDLLPVLKDTATKPLNVSKRSTDFFGEELDEGDMTTCKLKEGVIDKALFSQMITSCLHAIVGVLESQYNRYFQLDT